MSILTKEERAGWRNYITAAHRTPAVRVEDMHRALDTIDALGAERDNIKSIAEANHDTRTIGGAHAALREILSVIEGVDVGEVEQ